MRHWPGRGGTLPAIIIFAVAARAALFAAPEELGPETVKNGDFSGAFNAGLGEIWRVTGDASCGSVSQEKTMFTSPPSAQRVEIKDNYNIKQELSLEPGKPHRVSAKVKILSHVDQRPISIVINKTVVSRTSGSAPSKDFETLSGIWTQPEGDDRAVLYIGPVGECRGGSFVVDDVSCRQILNPQSVPAQKTAATAEENSAADLKKLIPEDKKGQMAIPGSVAAIIASAGAVKNEDSAAKEPEIIIPEPSRPSPSPAPGMNKPEATAATPPAAPAPEAKKTESATAAPPAGTQKTETAVSAPAKDTLTESASSGKSLDALAAAPGPEIKRVDSVLASVDGDPITLMDVQFESGREEARLSAVFSGRDLWDEVKKVRKKTLDDIIARKLIYNDYKTKTFEIPKQYFEDMLDSLAMDIADGTRPGLERKAKKFGVTLDELKEKAKIKVVVDIMVSDYFQRTVTLTPREIHEYYLAHEAEFSSPPQIDLDMIFVSLYGKNKDIYKKIVEEVASDIKNAGPGVFHSVARMSSDAPNADKGGSVGWIENSKLRPEFASVLEGAQKGFISGPVETSEGVYFLRVAGRKDAEKLEFGRVENGIRKKIEDKLRMDAFKEYNEKLKKDAIVRYYF
jgi:peptidyl-prolyl cis-trans isomerase SurA